MAKETVLERGYRGIPVRHLAERGQRPGVRGCARVRVIRPGAVRCRAVVVHERTDWLLERITRLEERARSSDVARGYTMLGMCDVDARADALWEVVCLEAPGRLVAPRRAQEEPRGLRPEPRRAGVAGRVLGIEERVGRAPRAEAGRGEVRRAPAGGLVLGVDAGSGRDAAWIASRHAADPVVGRPATRSADTAAHETDVRRRLAERGLESRTAAPPGEGVR